MSTVNRAPVLNSFPVQNNGRRSKPRAEDFRTSVNRKGRQSAFGSGFIDFSHASRTLRNNSDFRGQSEGRRGPHEAESALPV